VDATQERLTNGWEPDVPVEDSLLRRYLFHNVQLCAAFAYAGGGHVLETPEVGMADLGRPSGYWNAATLLQPPSDWDAVLDDVERFYAGGRGEAMLWSAWPTPDLRARGWHLSGHPPLCFRPPADLAPPPLARVDVEAVTTAHALAEWERVVVEGYPMPELLPFDAGAMAGPALLDDDRLACWLGRQDGRAVSAAASFSSHGIASFALGVTRPEVRRLGHWRALAAARLRAHPDCWTAGVFSDFSRPGAEAIGFVPVQRLTLWILDR
jgi:hypothetical protein